MARRVTGAGREPDRDACRQHITDIGQPDPGERPQDGWVGDDHKAANPAWWANYQRRG